MVNAHFFCKNSTPAKRHSTINIRHAILASLCQRGYKYQVGPDLALTCKVHHSRTYIVQGVVLTYFWQLLQYSFGCQEHSANRWLVKFFRPGFTRLRFSILDSRLSILDSRFSILDSGFWILDSGFSTLDSRLSTLESRFSIDSRFSTLDSHSRFSTLDSRLSILDSRFSILDSRFSMLDSRLSLLDSRFSTLDSPFSSPVTVTPLVAASFYKELCFIKWVFELCFL